MHLQLCRLVSICYLCNRVFNAREELELIQCDGLCEVEEECDLSKPRLLKTAPRLWKKVDDGSEEHQDDCWFDVLQAESLASKRFFFPTERVQKSRWQGHSSQAFWVLQAEVQKSKRRIWRIQSFKTSGQQQSERNANRWEQLDEWPIQKSKD